MAGILSGITVIDLTQNVAGPFCTQMLGDLGATVIKVERPGTGDDTRSWTPPKWDDEPATFLALNRNKKSICIDLNSKEGQEIVKKLAKDADVFVHSMKPGSLESRNLGYEELSTVNPSLLYAAISAFGEVGPLKHNPGYDPLIQAYSGIMSMTGNPDDDPARVGVSIIDMATGMWSLIGILSALYQRVQTGEGTKVTNSLLETGVTWVGLQMTNFMASGNLPKKMGTGMAMTAPYEAFKTKDDWAIIAAGNNRLFTSLCKALDIEYLLEDSRFTTNPDRVKNRNELHDLIEKVTMEYETEKLINILREGKVPTSRINTLDKVYNDEQVNALEMIKDVENSRISDFKIVDLPFRIGSDRSNINSMPPLLGEHSDEILKSLNYSEDEVASMKQSKIID